MLLHAIMIGATDTIMIGATDTIMIGATDTIMIRATACNNDRCYCMQ